MSDHVQQYLKKQAKKLHGHLSSPDPVLQSGALWRIRRALPTTRAMTDAEVIQSTRHSNCLEVVATEAQAQNWPALKTEVEAGTVAPDSEPRDVEISEGRHRTGLP